jgi:hypothetical protein
MQPAAYGANAVHWWQQGLRLLMVLVVEAAAVLAGRIYEGALGVSKEEKAAAARKAAWEALACCRRTTVSEQGQNP